MRCTAGVAIPLVIGVLIRQPAFGVTAAIGAFITGFTSLQGVYRTRLAAVLCAALGMSATSFAGALAAHSTSSLVATTFVAGYAFGTIGQLGPIASTVALNSFVAFVLFSSQPLSPVAAASDSGLVMAGGFIQALLLLLAWPAARRGVERAALVDVYRNLAAYARTIAEGSPSFPPIAQLATARQVLADPQPLARAGEIARLRRLLEDSEIVRRRLGALATAFSSDGERSATIRLARAAAERLDSVADTLNGIDEAGELSELIPSDRAEQLSGVSDLSAQLRDAAEAAAMLSGKRIPFSLLSRPRPGPYVQNHIDWFARDSLRFAVVLAIAMVLGRHFAADRGYWIPLTAALVLKPDFRTTFVRGFGRIAGTLVGAVIASIAVALFRGHVALETAAVLMTASAAYLTFNPNYALFTVAITSFVAIVLSMRGLPGNTTIEARLLDTLAGGALAMIGYLALPSWERRRTRSMLADLLDAQRRLALAILNAYAAPSSVSRKAIESARTDVWKARTAAEAGIDRTRQEPYRKHTIGASRALRILAATQRFALANLAFETVLETQRRVTLDGFALFTHALDAEMAELAAALRESRRAHVDGRLNATVMQLGRENTARDDPQCRFVVERLRAYAYATSRIASLVGRESASVP